MQKSPVLQELLSGYFNSVVGFDYFLAAQKFINELKSAGPFCFAHRILGYKIPHDATAEDRSLLANALRRAF
jgi:hypothetical protein